MIILFLFLLFAPACIWLLLKTFETLKKKSIDVESPSELTAVLIIHNEVSHLFRKTNQIIRELEELDFSKKELIIISDGSNDEFKQELNRINLPYYVKLIQLDHRQGKPHCINLANREAMYEFVIFSDARQDIRPGSFKILLDEFRDTKTGAVSGILKNRDQTCLVRRLVNYSKQLQSLSGNLVGVYGALFAIRKSLIPEIPKETVLDDMLISLHVLTQKKKVKIKPNAVITDIEFRTLCAKKRVLRIMAGLMQLITDKNLRSKFSIKALLLFFVGKLYRFYLPVIGLLILTGLSFYSIIYIGLISLIGLMVFPSFRYFLKSYTQIIQGSGSLKKHQTVFWNKIKATD